jgi:hypothetical protein
MKSFNCLHCGKEHQFKGYSYSNKYCDNQCQLDYQSKERIRQWLEEGRDWPGQVPAWAKKTLAERNGYKCEICSVSKWMSKLINLECDHIDGNHTNNSITNLRLICPNCHSQTDTYKNKNKGNGRQSRRKVV